jgi:hypothetical protein
MKLFKPRRARTASRARVEPAFAGSYLRLNRRRNGPPCSASRGGHAEPAFAFRLRGAPHPHPRHALLVTSCLCAAAGGPRRHLPQSSSSGSPRAPANIDPGTAG